MIIENAIIELSDNNCIFITFDFNYMTITYSYNLNNNGLTGLINKLAKNNIVLSENVINSIKGVITA